MLIHARAYADWSQKHSRLASKEALTLDRYTPLLMKNSLVYMLQTWKAFGYSISEIGN